MATQSQTVSVTASASAVTFAYWYSTIVVTVESGGTNVPVFVRTDGTAAVANAAGTIQVDPGQTAVLGNEMPMVDVIAGDNTQTANNTQVSIIGSGAGPTVVTVEVE